MDTPPAYGPFWQLAYQYVIPVLFSGLLALVGWVAIRVAQWVGQRLKESKWFAALDFAQRWAFDALLYAGTEFRTEYQRLIADGELSEIDRRRLRDMGTGIFKKWLDERKTKMLQEALGLVGIQFDQFLSSQVEKAILKLPLPSRAAKPALPLPPSSSETPAPSPPQARP